MILSDEQRTVLAAAAERILPSDDGPGASEAGAAAYIERLLETSFPSWQPLFGDGLDRLEELARELHGRSFPESSPEMKDEVLRRFQAEPDRLRQMFFRKLVSFTLEGFLSGDPGWSYLGTPEARPDHCLGKPRP